MANLALGRSLTEKQPPQGGSVSADLAGRRSPITLSLAEWRSPAPLHNARTTDVADIAVFELRDPFTAPFRPPLRIEPPNRVVPPGGRIAFHSFGFMATQDGVPTRGYLTAVDAGGWFVADGDDDFQRFIEEGLSGAPIFADGRVLGMVVQRLEKDSKQGLVIPAFALARAWPPLASPYPGLPAFDADTAHLFFGRGRSADPDAEPTGTLKEVLDRLYSQRLVALMGASGSGKSSLAKAGVADVYRRRGWSVVTLRPGLTPLRNLAEAIAIEVEGLGPSSERLQAMDRWEQALAVGRLMEAIALARGKGAAGVLFVIDQFEEFFPGRVERGVDRPGEPLAEAPEMGRQRAVILPQLRRVVEAGEAHCLLTARLDLIESMVSGDLEAARLLKDPYPIFVLTRMAAGEVREAIEGPAALFGVRTDAGFATDLAAATTQGEGRLPLLQETLRQCWAVLERGADGWWLRQPENTGRGSSCQLLEESLARRGDQALAEMRVDPTDVQRVLLGLVRIVSGRPVRRLLTLAEVAAGDRAVLERLAEERLVVIDGERNTAELVHEALMVRWPLLAAWIDEQRAFLVWRDHFEREFVAWRDGGREAKDVLRSHDLAQAQEWTQSPGRVRGRPTPEQAEFIRVSRDFYEAEAERAKAQLRRARRLLRVAIAAVGFMALAIGAGSIAFKFALDQTERAENETARAEKQTRVAEEQAKIAREQAKRAEDETKRAEDRTGAAQLQESRALAILAQQESAREDQGTAMLLALEALPEPAFGGTRPMSSEASAALRQAWMRNREIALIGHQDVVNDAAFSPDGRRVVTVSDDDTARVWDLSGVSPTATILDGHASRVKAASFSRDGKRVVTASWDETARVWDLSGPTPTATVLEGHSDSLVAASFSRNGKRVVTASWDKTARVWDLSGPTPTAIILKGHTDWVVAAAFSPNGRRVVTASNDDTARVWDLSGPTPTVTVLKGHTNNVISASFSPDGQRVVTASDDKTARVWDLSGPTPKAIVLEAHTDMFLAKTVSASFSPNGSSVVTASGDNIVQVWDLSEDTPTATALEGHVSAVQAVSFSPDGRHVVTVSADNTAEVWDLWAPMPTATVLKGFTGKVRAASISPDGRRAVTALDDNTARVWDLSGPTPTAMVLEGHDGRLVAASFSPEGRVVTATANNTARVWDLLGVTPPTTVLEGLPGMVRAASFSRDGERVVAASWGNTARVWDLSGPTPTATVLEGHGDSLMAASFSHDGKRVVTASLDKTARVWDLSGPKPTAIILKGHTDWVVAAAFSPNGRRVVTASNDDTARVWDLSGPTPTVTVLKGHANNVISASFSPDGQRVVTASDDKTARVWELSSPTPTATVLKGHTTKVWAASFSPDGRRVVTAADDNTARVWDLSETTPTATVLEGHSGQLRVASFSPDGQRVVTASDDKTARVWELSGPTPTATVLIGHTAKVWAASFSLDGRRVVTAADDNTARVWETYPDINELSTLVRGRLSRCLSSAQRQQFGLLVEDGSRPRYAIPAPDAKGLCPR